jgi:hypothetical protein
MNAGCCEHERRHRADHSTWGLDEGLLNQGLFTVLVLMALITTLDDATAVSATWNARARSIGAHRISR